MIFISLSSFSVFSFCADFRPFDETKNTVSALHRTEPSSLSLSPFHYLNIAKLKIIRCEVFGFHEMTFSGSFLAFSICYTTFFPSHRGILIIQIVLLENPIMIVAL